MILTLLSAKKLRAPLLLLSAAALLSVAGCKDVVVDYEGECASVSDCGDGQICSDAKVCVTPVCGDGKIEGDETCDNGSALNSDTKPDACRTDCTLAACGDGVVDAGEACDEGTAANDGTTCNANCTLAGAEAAATPVRWGSLSILEPRLHSGDDPEECDPDFADFVNGMVFTNLVSIADEETELYGLNVIQSVGRPMPGASRALSMSFPETCRDEESGPDSCDLSGASMTASITWDFVEATDEAPCFERIAATANAAGWIDHPENTLETADIPKKGAGTCLKGTTSDTFKIAIKVEEVFEIPLHGAYMAVELDESGTNPKIKRGMLGGFLTTAEAEALNFLEIVIFSSLLNGGAGACVDSVDLDVGPDGTGGTSPGWWMYVGFDGEYVVDSGL